MIFDTLFFLISCLHLALFVQVLSIDHKCTGNEDYLNFIPKLIDAVKPEQVAYIKCVLQKGKNDTSFHRQMSIGIVESASRGKDHLLKLLLQYGGDPNSVSEGGNTALLLASYAGMFMTQ